MKAKKSDFVIWFEAEHGKRPCMTSLHALEKRVAEYRSRLQEDRNLLERCYLYEARAESALRAWNLCAIFENGKVRE